MSEAIINAKLLEMLKKTATYIRLHPKTWEGDNLLRDASTVIREAENRIDNGA